MSTLPAVAPRLRGAPPLYTADPYHPWRRRTRVVMVGPVGVGGGHPIRLQSMTTTRTQDIDATAAQAIRLVEAGCEIVRITAPTVADARAIGEVRTRLRALGITAPLVADIHFSPAAALAAAENADKVRVNPGNFADSRKFAVREYSDDEYAAELERVAARFTPVVLACRERGVALRIGTNHGSLSDRVMNRFGDSPEGMVESALEFVRICEANRFYEIILSMKASNAKVMIAAYRLLVARMDAEAMPYPLHLGVTEAGNGDDARIKSAAGIGSLLLDGLGDTIRVSLAEEPEAEIPVARAIAALCTRPLAPQGSSAAADRRCASGASDPSDPSDPSDLSPNGGEAAGGLGSARSRHGSTPHPQSLPPLPYDPYHYERRPSRPVALGTVILGAGEQIAVAGRVPDREPVALPVLGARLRKGVRPDFLVLDVEDAAAVDRARDLAWKGEGPAARPLVARGRYLDHLLAVLPHVEAIRLILGSAEESVLSQDPAVLGVGPHPAAAGPVPASHDPLPWLPRPEVIAAQACLATGRILWLEYVAAPGEAGPEESAYALAAAARRADDTGLRALLLSLQAPDARALVHGTRLLAALTAEAGLDCPIVLQAPPGEAPMLPAAAALGSLLCDGLGDAVEAASVPLAFDLLQGAGARLTRTDYVACPSCGRTLFDLQSTTERIKERTSHLKGVKIAIMGCVVNGPGEMADADFGYMGGSPGQVNLYVGKECVERGVPEAQADERLVALIRAHGRWVEAGDDDDE